MTTTYTLKHQLSSETETLLLAINTVCTELHIEFFVAGATAREVMLTHVHGRRSGRQTRDIDIAVFINHWQQFDLLKNAMIERGAKPLKRNQHRLIWDGMKLDIIPFGPIADENKIAWPPDREITLHVDGFQEAWEHGSMPAGCKFPRMPKFVLARYRVYCS